jgi:hypothetical protein
LAEVDFTLLTPYLFQNAGYVTLRATPTTPLLLLAVLTTTRLFSGEYRQ